MCEPILERSRSRGVAVSSGPRGDGHASRVQPSTHQAAVGCSLLAAVFHNKMLYGQLALSAWLPLEQARGPCALDPVSVA